MNIKQRLLLIEDEEAIRLGLVDLFTFHGYQVDTASDGAVGLNKAKTGSYGAIIIDLMLPEIDGFTVCDEIRKSDREQPIIILTAKSEDEDIINGLSLGADDYITKPFSVRELLLRVEAVLRRSRKIPQSGDMLHIGSELAINLKSCVGTTEAGKELQFTRREVEILEYLCRNDHRAVTRDELLQELWGYSKAAKIETRTVDIHIAKLRRKIEPDPKHPKFIVTVKNQGYQLCGAKVGG